MTQIVVIGGGITGLVAAREAALAGATVTVVEPERLGGKVRSGPFDGGSLDEAADAFLARVPEGIELCRQLGLDGDLVAPAARRAYMWSRGALRLLPEAQVLGVPTDLDELAASEILSAEGLDRVRREVSGAPLVAPVGDVTIGALMRERLGDEAAERLIDPLVGGINAGDTDRLSLAATVPQLDAAVRSGHPSLIEACRAQRADLLNRSVGVESTSNRPADPADAADSPAGVESTSNRHRQPADLLDSPAGVESTSNRHREAPVFLAPRGGMGALVAALVDDLRARDVTFVADTVAALEPDGRAWQARLGGGATLVADGVVLTLPAGSASEVLRPHAARAATLLAAIPYASVAMVSLAVPRASVERDLDGSGFLVPRVEGRTITACSWTSAKWPHLAGAGSTWLRASVGRDGADAALALPDDPLVDEVLADLGATMALRGKPTEVRVTRWTSSFPQYRPGHLGRVDAIDDDLAIVAPTLVVAGAALRGLGVPACIRQGAAATRRLLTTLDARP